MESAMTRTSQRRWTFATVTVALVIAAVGLPSLPARAEDHDGGRGRQEFREHGGPERYRDHDRGWDRDRDYELYSYGRPSYVYAPPPVYYYAPPPGPPVIDFVFPLRFR